MGVILSMEADMEQEKALQAQVQQCAHPMYQLTQAESGLSNLANTLALLTSEAQLLADNISMVGKAQWESQAAAMEQIDQLSSHILMLEDAVARSKEVVESGFVERAALEQELNDAKVKIEDMEADARASAIKFWKVTDDLAEANRMLTEEKQRAEKTKKEAIERSAEAKRALEQTLLERLRKCVDIKDEDLAGEIAGLASSVAFDSSEQTVMRRAPPEQQAAGDAHLQQELANCKKVHEELKEAWKVTEKKNLTWGRILNLWCLSSTHFSQLKYNN